MKYRILDTSSPFWEKKHDHPGEQTIVTEYVSPDCDCHSENDIPIIPDVGMFASFDPVALDVACADAVNRMPVIEGSVLSDHLNEDGHHGEGHDHFYMTHPDTEWRSCIEHAVKIGLGNDRYELVKI